MIMKTFEETWQGHEKTLRANGMKDEGVETSKKLFYCGAMEVFQMVKQTVENSLETDQHTEWEREHDAVAWLEAQQDHVAKTIQEMAR